MVLRVPLRDVSRHTAFANDKGRAMKLPIKASFLFIFVSLSLVTAGCFRNPNARKQKYLESGAHYFQQGKYREAAIQFGNALQIDKNFAPAHYQLAQCFLRQGLFSNAFRELSTVVELEPKNWQAQLDLANLLFEGRRFLDARDRATLILKESPNDVGAQLLLANSNAQLGNTQVAIEEAQQAVQMAPDKPAPYLILGLLQEKAQQISEGEQNLRKAVSLDPKALPPRLGLASFYQRQHRLPEAEVEYSEAIKADSSSPVPPASLATLYLASGKRDQAEQVLRDAKKAMPDNPAGYRMLADFYLSTGDSTKALSEFASLSKEHPKDLVVKKLYVQLLIQNKQLDQAMILNTDILGQNAKDADGLVFKGQVLNLQNKPAEALPVLQEAIKSNPENPVAHSQLGTSYSRTGDSAAAEREWREAVKLKPSTLDAQEYLAAVAVMKGDLPLLEQSASAWLLYAPSAPQGYLMHGTALMKKGDASGAEKDLRHVLEIDAKNSIACARLGDLRVSQKRYKEAQEFYEQALDYNPRARDALQGLVTVSVMQKQPEKALQRVQTQVAKVPDDSAFYYLLGAMLLGNHKTTEAQSALENAVRLDKKNVNACLLLAQIQDAAGQQDQAAGTYDRSIRENPSDVRLYLALGSLEERRNNWQRAEQLNQKVLQIQADQPTAANNLSFLLLEHGGDVNYALSLAQTARHAMPNSAYTADTLGWAYYKMGVYENAIHLLQEAIEKAPQSATYHYHLGVVYQKSEKVALAKSSFQRALQLDPKSKHADEIRQALDDLNKSQ
jgi:tetratricopeptide (TPR) repeat protein